MSQVRGFELEGSTSKACAACLHAAPAPRAVEETLHDSGSPPRVVGPERREVGINQELRIVVGMGSGRMLDNAGYKSAGTVTRHEVWKHVPKPRRGVAPCPANIGADSGQIPALACLVRHPEGASGRHHEHIAPGRPAWCGERADRRERRPHGRPPQRTCPRAKPIDAGPEPASGG